MQLDFDLTDSPRSPQKLPLEEGDVTYYPAWLEQAHADQLFATLQSEIAWRQDTIKLFGKLVKIPRLQAWYGAAHCRYGYSGLALTPLPFTPLLNNLQAKLEAELNAPFNCVLCNWYRDGRDSMSMHADDEPELGYQPTIASITLGTQRAFDFKHKRTTEKHRVVLEHGSLLTMSGDTQSNYLHGINKSKRVSTSRINLTFRYIEESL
jgi:alkylated DNA repair dioxygenase AlkB